MNSLTDEKVSKILEYPMHPGASEFRDRFQPAITSETLETLENFSGFFISLGTVVFLMWRWYINQGQGIEFYINKLREIEKAFIQMEMHQSYDLDELRHMNMKISQIKNDAMEDILEKRIKNFEILPSFLSDVSDLRQNITNTILKYESIKKR